MKDYYLEPIPPSPPELDAPDPSVFSVRLFRRSDSRRPPITLITKTILDRDSWFQAILTAMDNVSPSENSNQGHVLQMTTFLGNKPAECFQCGKTLKGSFFQGYRCLRCQVNLHKSCVGACPCIEIASAGGGGGVKRADSMALPTAMPENLERSNSTLSLAAPSAGSTTNGKLSKQVQELQRTLRKELEETPLEEQPWFAGELAGKVACDRLESLPVGTFLVRRRANGQFALMLKTPEEPRGVKAMAIVQEGGGRGGENSDPAEQQVNYCFSGARKFHSIQKLVTFYRDRDLTENFDYPALKGVPLRHPYKNL